MALYTRQRANGCDQQMDALFSDSYTMIQGNCHFIFLPIYWKLLQASELKDTAVKQTKFRQWAQSLHQLIGLLDQKLPQRFSAVSLRNPKPQARIVKSLRSSHQKIKDQARRRENGHGTAAGKPRVAHLAKGFDNETWAVGFTADSGGLPYLKEWTREKRSVCLL